MEDGIGNAPNPVSQTTRFPGEGNHFHALPSEILAERNGLDPYPIAQTN